MYVVEVDKKYACKACYDKDPTTAKLYAHKSGPSRCYSNISKHGFMDIKNQLVAKMDADLQKAIAYSAVGLYAEP